MRCSKCKSSRLVEESYILGQVIDNKHEKRKYTKVACLDCKNIERYVEVLNEKKE